MGKKENDSAEFYHIETNDGDIIYSNLIGNCFECHKSSVHPNEINTQCTFDGKKRKRSKIHYEKGSLYLCSSSIDLINSNRLFKDKIMVYMDFLNNYENLVSSITLKHHKQIDSIRTICENEIKRVKEEANNDTKRLIHNLTSINAHSIQEIYALVPQELLTKDINKQFGVIRELLIEDPDEAARAFMRIAKNNAAMKAEFSVFKKLTNTSPTLSFKYHQIRKVLMNVLHIFFQDFSDKGVTVSVDSNYESVLLDYESIYVSFYHIVENATKYIARNSNLRVSFLTNDDSFIIRFNMLSIQIRPDEIEDIFQEGKKGAMAVKTQQAGDGFGLSIVIKLLNINKSSLIIKSNVNTYLNKSINGVDYENNHFDVVFPISSKQDSDLAF